MEDNNKECNDCFLCKHPVLKHVLAGLLIFLGAFAAFYVVADWHFKRMFDPAIQMKKFDRDMMKQERQIDRMAKKEFNQKFEQNTAQFIRVDQTPDSYKIVIDLRPFGNDEKNINIKTEGKTLYINASSENTKHNKHEVLRYSQAFNFGDTAEMDNITKVRQGNNYIITVPVK